MERDCNTCKHHVQGRSIDDAPPRCWDCIGRMGQTRLDLPLWEPHEEKPMSKVYDATFRDDHDCLCGPRLPAPALTATGVKSDGSTASYYELPEGATQLQDLISFKNMNAQIGEIFRACYRMGQASHSDNLRDAKKILFYAKAEVERLEKFSK